jgi:hypothetical protein
MLHQVTRLKLGRSTTMLKKLFGKENREYDYRHSRQGQQELHQQLDEHNLSIQSLALDCQTCNLVEP